MGLEISSSVLVVILFSADDLCALTEAEGQNIKKLMAQASAFLVKPVLFTVRFKEINLLELLFFNLKSSFKIEVTFEFFCDLLGIKIFLLLDLRLYAHAICMLF